VPAGAEVPRAANASNSPSAKNERRIETIPLMLIVVCIALPAQDDQSVG
jgi:hypothetical protein